MAEIRERVSAALKEHYVLEAEIGSGGMGIVYSAQDVRHRRSVAIKVLRPELMDRRATARFLREIRLTARLQHPGIVPLYESGEADGILFFVMPLVEGETLGCRIAREHQIPLPDAVAIACDVTDALAFAHRNGVVHRDIKPSNIFLSGGRALIADFGIAAPAADRSLDTGAAVRIVEGSLAYMSPESARGRSNETSDIYSLGCVLYEMLIGEPPFRGPTAQAVMARHAIEPPPYLRVLRPSIPVSLEEAVHKSLHKAPVDRFMSALEFKRALLSVPLGVPPAALHPPPIRAVAVLPFVNLSPDPANEYFSDGVTEEIISALTRVRDLRVASRTASFAYKGIDMDVRILGQRLGVGALVDGSVRQSGKKLRVTAELTSAADGFTIWSETFEHDAEDIFRIQEQISRTVAETLKLKLVELEDEPLVRAPTESVEAYNLYLQGRHQWNKRTPEGVQEALHCYTEALEHDRRYALAYSGLADAYITLSQFQYLPPRIVLPKAESNARLALQCDPDLGEAHNSLAHVYEVFHWEWEKAGEEYAQALSLNPRYATAHAWYSDFLMEMGRESESVSHMSRALQLEPHSVPINFQAATQLYRRRLFDSAVSEYLKVVEMDPSYYLAHLFLGLAYLQRGSVDEAVDVFQRAIAVTGPGPAFQMGLGCAYAASHREKEAQALLRALEESARASYVPSGFMTILCACLRKDRQALDYLDRAFEERSILMALLRVEPMLDRFRGRARFRRLEERIFPRE